MGGILLGLTMVAAVIGTLALGDSNGWLAALAVVMGFLLISWLLRALLADSLTVRAFDVAEGATIVALLLALAAFEVLRRMGLLF